MGKVKLDKSEIFFVSEDYLKICDAYQHLVDVNKNNGLEITGKDQSATQGLDAFLGAYQGYKWFNPQELARAVNMFEIVSHAHLENRRVVSAKMREINFEFMAMVDRKHGRTWLDTRDCNNTSFAETEKLLLA